MIHNTVKYIRAAYGMTQTEFGKMLGVSKNTISSLETQQFQPSAELLFRIHKQLAIPMEWVLYDVQAGQASFPPPAFYQWLYSRQIAKVVLS